MIASRRAKCLAKTKRLSLAAFLYVIRHQDRSRTCLLKASVSGASH